jgi:hypothetical protein
VDKTTGPSTSLRFGRDDKSAWELIGTLQQICHRDRSVATRGLSLRLRGLRGQVGGDGYGVFQSQL